jgi:hypothetical protein
LIFAQLSDILQSYLLQYTQAEQVVGHHQERMLPITAIDMIAVLGGNERSQKQYLEEKRAILSVFHLPNPISARFMPDRLRVTRTRSYSVAKSEEQLLSRALMKGKR